MDFKDRLKGCLVYGAIGDALGSRFEGTVGNEEIPSDFHWRISDDTQLTLATCEAIYDSNRIMPERVAAKFLEWFNQRKLTGLGSSTLKALRELQVGGHWALVGDSGERAAGNGAAMRIAPLAFKTNIDHVTIRDVCSITHKNDEACTGALAIYYAICYARSGAWTGEPDLIEKVIAHLPDTNVKDRLIKLQTLKNLSVEALAHMHKPTGYVADSVPSAIFAAQQIGRLPVQSIFQELIRCGGDTDTVCSMAGQIMGTLLGYRSIPDEWRDKIDHDLKAVQESVDFMVDRWRE
jgi:ADP-ribosyl-[dinitrogen reductase] hydrolase